MSTSIDNNRLRTVLDDLKNADRARTIEFGLPSTIDIHTPSELQAVLNEVARVDKLQSTQWVAQLQQLIKEAEAATGAECDQTRTALECWMNQPAQNVVPWIHVDGLNLQSWVERWRKCCFELRELEQQNNNANRTKHSSALPPPSHVGGSGGASGVAGFAVSPSKVRL